MPQLVITMTVTKGNFFPQSNFIIPSFLLDSGSQLRIRGMWFLPPRGHLAMSGDIFVPYNCRPGMGRDANT